MAGRKNKNQGGGAVQVEEQVVVGRWDCTRCGSIGNVGTDAECAGCGAPRGKDVAFYLPEDDRSFLDDFDGFDEDTLSPGAQEADWVCEHCGASTKASEAHCAGCGAPRGASRSLSTASYGPGEEPRSDDEARKGRRRAAPPIRTGRNWKRIAAGVLGGVAAVFALLLTLIFYTRTYPATVTAMTWERTIAVEENRLLTEGDWSVPEGGKELGSERRIRSYRDVLDHYETATRTVSKRVQTGTRSERVKTGTRSNGNGTFTETYETRSEPVYETRHETETYQKPIYRKEPVYDTWHRYTIWRWKHDRDERAAGALPGDEPRWPIVRLAQKEREGERTEAYRVSLREPKGKEHKAEMPEQTWRALRVGGPCKVTANAFGTILEVR